MNKIYANVTEDENVDEPNFQWVVLASEAEEREAALRDELESYRKNYVTRFAYEAALKVNILMKEEADEHLSVVVDQRSKIDYLQQRLTIIEKYVQRLANCSKNQDSVATGYLSDILDVIKGENV